MAVKQLAFKFIGMQLDLDMSILNQSAEGGQFLFSAKNIRFITDEANSLYAITNERGTKSIEFDSSSDVPSSSETPIGTAVLEDELILFTVNTTTTSNKNNIYDIWWDESSKKLKSLRLYNGDLGIDVEHPLDTKVSVDTELKKKVYWIDGLHCPRVINVAALKEDSTLKNFIQEKSNVFDSVKTDFLSSDSVNIQKTYGAGQFPSGTLQYIITYVDFNGVETAPIYTSSLYYTSPTSDRAGKKDEICKNTFTLTIDNIPKDSYYKYLRVYSITKTSKEENGQGRLVKEFLLKDAEVIGSGSSEHKKVRVVDQNEGEEFDVNSILYLGSQYIKPKTFEIKDNAMFFGNYDLEPIEKLDVINTGFTHKLGLDLAYFVQPEAKTLPTKPQLDCNASEITSFKTNQHYRLGIVFTNEHNGLSDIVYIDNSLNDSTNPDKRNTDYKISSGKPFCLFHIINSSDPGKQTLFDDIKTLLNNKKWKYATPVIVYPREDDKEVVCQGYLNPTVYNPINRKSGIVGHSSWLFRFIPPRKYGIETADLGSCDKIVPEFRHNTIINNVCNFKLSNSYIGREGSVDKTESGRRWLYYKLNPIHILNVKGFEFSSYPIADFRHVWEGTEYSFADTDLQKQKWWNWEELKEPGVEYNKMGFGYILPAIIWNAYFFWPDTRKLAKQGDGEFRRFRLNGYSGAQSNNAYRWTYFGELSGYVPASPYMNNRYYSTEISNEDYDKIGGRKNFYITDNNILTLNSPDTELSEKLIGINLTLTTIKYIGALNIKGITTTKKLIAESQTAFNSYTEETVTIDDYQLSFPRLFTVNYGSSPYIPKASSAELLKDGTSFDIVHSFVVSPIHSLKMNFPLNMHNALFTKGDNRGDFKPDSTEDSDEGTGGTMITANAVSIKNNRLSHYFNCDTIFFDYNPNNNNLISLNIQLLIYSDGENIQKLEDNNLFESSISTTIILDNTLSTCIFNDDVAIEYDKQTGNSLANKWDFYFTKIHSEGNILPFSYWSGKHLVLLLNTSNSIKTLLPTLGLWTSGATQITSNDVFNPISSYSEDTPINSYTQIDNTLLFNNIIESYEDTLSLPILNLNTLLLGLQIDKGIVWLGEITRQVTNQYGGTSQEALINNKWERAGHTVLVLNLELLIWNEGDCFFDTFRSLKSCEASEDEVNNTTDVIEFKCESWTNPNSVTSELKNLKDVTTRNKDNFNLYNEIYSTHSSYKPFVNLTEDDFKSNSFPKQVTVTNSKLINSTVDEWSHITVAAVIDMFNDSNAISKLCNFGDLLYVFQDHNIDTILYGTNVMISTESNTPIELGKSSKVEGSNKVANFGCLNKQAIAYTNNAIYFIETETGLLYLLAQLPANITLAKGMSTWFANDENRHGINDVWLPNALNNFKLLFDKLNEELIITDSRNCLALNDNVNLVFTSFYDYNDIPYFEVISNHNVLIDKTCGMWFKNEGNYNSFFGQPQPYYIEFIANAEYPSYKTFTTINYTGDEFEYSNNNWILHGGNDSCGLFDEITVSNEYQTTTSEVTLVNDRHRPSSLKEKFRFWGINIPRTSGSRRDRFSNPWIKIKLSKDLQSNIKIKLHNLIVNYLS